MKFKILLVLIFITQLTFSQSKLKYLKSNRYDMLNSNFNLKLDHFKILGFGAYHGSQETEKAEQILLRKLLKEKKIKYYLPETDFGIAYYFNEFLKSGDTVLLKDLIKNYGKRVPQERSVEAFNKWKDIKKLNDNERPDNRLTVVGIDLMVNYKYSVKLLLELLPLEKGILKTYDDLVEMIRTDSTDYSPNYDSYSKSILKNFITDYHNNKSLFDTTAKKQEILAYLINNITQTFKKQNREKVIFDNYVSLNQIYKFKDHPQFLRMGFFHLEKDKEGNNASFFAKLIENKVYSKAEVISMIGFLTKSEVLWKAKYDNSKKYIGYTIEGGFGIGDYWKEYFKGIGKLKNSKISNLTLFKLNTESSPYHTGTDLMEIKLFLKKSNKNDLKGKATTDYFDYAVLISNSKANTPIEELDK